MDNLEFLEIVHGQFEHCVSVLEEKREKFEFEGDRLSHFKSEFEEDPLTACRGLMIKHSVLLNDMIRDGRSAHSSAEWIKEITHHINYLFLMAALLKEPNESRPEGV